jgi:ABC-type antimicrobial peptide transport system permease subunit
VVVINQTMAQKLWSGQNAIGRRMMFGPQARTVIGVVADIRNKRLDTAATQQMYLPMAEQPQAYASIVVRGSAGAAAMMAKIRDAVRGVDSNQPVYALRTMDDVINTSVAARRTNTFMLTIFGVVALALAGVGVYGVLSYGVTQRTREIGVRVALGAQRGDVVRLVVTQGMKLAGAGIGVGLVGAYALSRVLASILYEVSPHDPRVFAGAPLVLAGIGVLAVLLPALRATRLDAMTALRTE